MKREAGENPARTRHCENRAYDICHWETGKASYSNAIKSGDLP